MNGLIYDLEIVKGIPAKGEPKKEGVEYCEGWHDHRNMGISVICAYDMLEGRHRVFLKDNFAEFFELMSLRTHLIGFNNIGFDNKVLSHHGTLPLTGYYDILSEIWTTHGKRFTGSGLDAVCTANGLGGKSGNGALAPEQWQRGEFGSVIDYCLHDVMLTLKLFELCQQSPVKTVKGLLKLRKVKC
jgi:hypothetical protein